MSFVDMWEAASGRFQEQTGRKLERNPGISLDDCFRRIEAARPSNSTEKAPFTSEKRHKLTRYTLNTLRCLKLLGGVVAEGAEMVLAPSKICFSAFAMLLDIPEKVENFWDRVDSLLDALWPSLSDFEIYGDMSQFDQIDYRLKRAIHMLMICFVDICALSVSLRSMRTWQKFKVTAKQLAFEESDLDNAITRFQELSKYHDSTKATLALKTVLESRSDITKLLDEASETGGNVSKILQMMQRRDEARNATERRGNELKTIKKKLNLEEQVKKSEDIGKALSTQRTPRTAEWYENHNDYPEYGKWADIKNPDANQILLVIGEQNTGKSTLLASIARSLRGVDTSNSSSRSCVSAYFFQNSSGKDGEEKRPIETAIKCIAYMIAEQDEQYAKELSKSLDKSDAEKRLNNATARELWYLLDIASPRKKYTHFIIIDGIEGLSKPFQKSREDFFEILASSSSETRTRQSQIGPRIAVSARSEPTAISLRDLALTKFDIQDHTVADMQRFIESELKDNEIFQELDEDSVKMRGMIQEKLVSKVKGNFTRARTSIDRIRRVVEADDPDEEAEINRILNDSKKNEENFSGTVIRQLQEQLNAAEVRELNELLMWVIYGYSYFDFQALEAALFLGGKKKSMLRLSKKLKGKYAPLIKLDEDGFAKMDEDMIKAVLKPRAAPGHKDEPQMLSATITISKGELHRVQTFLWTLSQKINQESLIFQQLGERTDMKGAIKANFLDSHMAIVRCTFNLLANEPSERTKAIASYLLRCLPRHLEALEQCNGTDVLTNDEKSEIGSGLYHMLFSNVIEKHWRSCEYADWYGEAKDVMVFRRWLGDGAATAKLGPRDHEWLEEVENDSNPNQALLARIMKTIARRWLRNEEWEASRPFEWIKGYLAMVSFPVSPPHAYDMDEITNPIQPPMPSDQQDVSEEVPADEVSPIENVEEWCTKVLKDNIKDALWHQRLGETLRSLDRNDDGVKAFNKALELGGSEKSCLEGLAHCFANMKPEKLNESCRQLEKALVIMESEDNPDQAKTISTYLKLAEWYSSLKDHEKVEEYTTKASERAPESPDSQLDALKLCLECQNSEQVTRLLRRLLDMSKDQGSSSMIHRVLARMSAADYNISLEQAFLRCFRLLERNTDVLHRFLDAMKEGLENAETQIHEVVLLIYRGIWLYYFSHQKEEARLAWVRCLEKSIESDSISERNLAATLLSADRFEVLADTPEEEHHRLVERMRWFADIQGSVGFTSSSSHLASYYMLQKDHLAARSVLQTRIDSAFEQLSDEYEFNDSSAYYDLGCTLAQLGDNANALAAFSLRLPWTSGFDFVEYLLDFEDDESKAVIAELLAKLQGHRQPSAYLQIMMALRTLEEIQPKAEEGVDESTNSHYSRIRETLLKWTDVVYLSGGTWCDNCSKALGSDMDFYHCLYCHDIDFCNDCWNSLHEGGIMSGTLRSLMCKKTHTWLRLAKWNKITFLRSFGGRVIKGGSINADGLRSGGEEVSSKEWLDGLKKDWGFVDNRQKEVPLNGEAVANGGPAISEVNQ
ncbi:hypothetical protein COL516b_004033 [Colletotrichum fioriniae]|nr:uncharacterized protein COL516b_004033 [Colletotrichum fioriniae]KAJ0307419.1 hypothetical protein COL516b_004033 [Colletotrichum fioriniae]